MLHIKRFHDRGKSGWWVLILFIPVIGFFWAIIDLGILQGDPGDNRFGPPAVGASASAPPPPPPPAA
jgi:uncharacterized membrane protein YhaH (DUF805 family)